MIIKEEIVDDIVVIGVKGKLMGASETTECHQRVKDYISNGYIKIVVDLSKVKWVNSRGLGMLIACYTSCRNNGGNLKIAGYTKKTRSVFSITKLDTVFELFNDVNRAVASY